MNDELEKIKQVFLDKNAAKGVALVAVGEARIDEQERYLSSTGLNRAIWRAMLGEERQDAVDAWIAEDETRYSSHWVTWQENGIQGKEGRLQQEFQELCDKYVEDHPEEFSDQIRAMPIEQCVLALSTFRSAGFEREQWVIEVWLKHHFEPQVIGGPIVARVRFPNGPKGLGN